MRYRNKNHLRHQGPSHMASRIVGSRFHIHAMAEGWRVSLTQARVAVEALQKTASVHHHVLNMRSEKKRGGARDDDEEQNMH